MSRTVYMPSSTELLTPAETSALSGVSQKAIYKLARESLPSEVMVRRSNSLFFTFHGAVCARLDREMPRSLSTEVRKRLYGQLHRGDWAVVTHKAGPLSYVLDPKPAADEVGARLKAYRSATGLIVEDPEIQGGAATFRGTRILVHEIADLLAHGETAEAVKAAYPALSEDMLAAAPIFAKTHPRRGRPRAPAWRKAEPISERRYALTAG